MRAMGLKHEFERHELKHMSSEHVHTSGERGAVVEIVNHATSAVHG